MKKSLFIFILLQIFVLCGCETSGYAKSVTFENISGSSTSTSQVKVVFQQEKDYEGKFADILIKSSEDNTTLNFTIEIGDSYTLTLPSHEESYSLAKLIADYKLGNTHFENYENCVSKTFIITSNKDCTLTFVAIASENANGEALTDFFEISDTYSVDITKSWLKCLKKNIEYCNINIWLILKICI